MAIMFVGATAVAATTMTIATHQANDLLVMYAFRDGSTTAPTLPTGWTAAAPATGASTTSSARVAYRIATAAGTTSGTWTNATCLVCHVYRNAVGIGSTVAYTTNVVLNTMQYPTMTMQVVNGTSWVALFGGHVNTDGQVSTPPSGTVNRSFVNGAAADAGSFDTGGGVISRNSSSAAYGGSSGDQCNAGVEIRAGTEPTNLFLAMYD